MGVIAQDVEKVFPEMVSTDQNGYKKVNYSELPYLMLEAIRDLKAENDKLREQVAEVGELRELHLKNQQARLDRLEAELKQLKGEKTEELAASHVSFK